MIGTGLPDALHDNIRLLPSLTVTVARKTFTEGASEKDRGQDHCKCHSSVVVFRHSDEGCS